MFQGPENALLVESVESVHIPYNLAMVLLVGKLGLLILLCSGVLRCQVSSYVSQSIDYNINSYIHTALQHNVCSVHVG